LFEAKKYEIIELDITHVIEVVMYKMVWGGTYWLSLL